MNGVAFYDFDFNRLGEFPRCISFNATRKYCGFGTAEIHFSLEETEVIILLENNPYLFFVAEGIWAVVSGWKIGEDIAVFARTPEWLLTKRGSPALSYTDETSENIVRSVVLDVAGDFLAMGEMVGDKETMDYSTTDVRVLHDVVCEVLEARHLGFSVVPDISQKRFVFRVYSGTERTILISKSNRTAYDMEYVAEKQNMVCNSGWYQRRFEDMGGWDAAKNSPSLKNEREENVFRFYKITSGHSNRFDLRCVEGEYIFCNTSDGKWQTTPDKPQSDWFYKDNAEVAGAKKWDAVLQGVKSETEGNAEIGRLKEIHTSFANVIGAEFQKDYDLGDTVRVQSEFGKFRKTEKKRVTAVNIYYDADGTGVVPVLSSLEE